VHQRLNECCFAPDDRSGLWPGPFQNNLRTISRQAGALLGHIISALETSILAALAANLISGFVAAVAGMLNKSYRQRLAQTELVP
jgi:ABC-type microcin C transport system permease subunit YejE